MKTPEQYADDLAVGIYNLTRSKTKLIEIKELARELFAIAISTAAHEYGPSVTIHQEACDALNEEVEGLRLANGALIRSNRELRERLTQLRKIGEQIPRNGPWESLGELLKKGV